MQCNPIHKSNKIAILSLLYFLIYNILIKDPIIRQIKKRIHYIIHHTSYIIVPTSPPPPPCSAARARGGGKGEEGARSPPPPVHKPVLLLG